MLEILAPIAYAILTEDPSRKDLTNNGVLIMVLFLVGKFLYGQFKPNKKSNSPANIFYLSPDRRLTKTIPNLPYPAYSFISALEDVLLKYSLFLTSFSPHELEIYTKIKAKIDSMQPNQNL